MRDSIVRNLRAFLPYFIAGVIFVVVGVNEPKFMLNWAPGIALLFVVAWVIPSLWRKRRGK